MIKKSALSMIQQYVADQNRLRNEIVHGSNLYRALRDCVSAAEQAKRYMHEQSVSYEASMQNASYLGGENFREMIRASVMASEHMKEHARSYEVAAQHVLRRQREFVIPEQNDTPESFTSPSIPAESDVVVEVPTSELSTQNPASLRATITVSFGVKGELSNATPEPPVIWRAPGARFNDFLQVLLTDQAYRRFIMPALTEMWCEHHGAHKAGDKRAMRMAIVWGVWFLLRASGPAILRTLVKWFGFRAG